MSVNNKEFNADDHDDGLDPEGDDILELLNGEADEGDGLEDDEEVMEEFEPQDGDTPEVLRTKLTAKNRFIRMNKKTIKRLQKQLDEKQETPLTAEQLAKIVQGKGQEEEAAGPTIEELKEQIDEDPTAVVDLMLQQNQALEQKLANVLKQQEAYLNKKYAPDGGETAPEVIALAERLKARPEYEGFDTAQLITVAKTLKPLKKRVARVPARTVSTGLPMTASEAEVEKANKGALEAMGYTDED